MKILRYIFGAGVLMSVLCAVFVACNDEPDGLESGLGEEIPGVEVQQATGTIIGSFGNGFASLLLQVDEEFPIGGTIETLPPPGRWIYTTLPETESGTYLNIIQVQHKLPVAIGNRISFSFREFREEKDFELLFSINAGVAHASGEFPPNIPICVITDYEILNN